jgi:primosomal protein N' (replication factor Y) (superfamily II helicase)
MPHIAKIIVDITLDREFDYIVPSSFEGRVHIGSRVVVPFGSRRIAGYVVNLSGHSDRTGLKEILSLADEKPFVKGSIVTLAKWMADYYCAPLEHAIRTVLPGPIRRKGNAFKKQMFVRPADPSSVPQPARRLSPQQTVILNMIASTGGMFLNELTKNAGTTTVPVRGLEKKGLVMIEPASVRRDPQMNRTILRTEPLPLMPEQASALAVIKECIEACDGSEQAVSTKSPNVVLIYGVTGSGKTEIYMQAIDHVLKKGKGAIVLVPEISLTPQAVERFAGRFGDRIAILHSHLSDGERHDEWHRIRDGKADIVIGARSAVFAPVENLGLIVVDEEHEPTYKQEESPRYNARDVAVMRGRIEDCTVLLGSATPSLESWVNARKGKYLLAVLHNRVDNRKMPVMQIIDMRREMARTGHVSAFSQELLDAIRHRLERSEQTMLFINRRGFATSLVCPKCGYVSNCDQCSVALTYHRSGNELRCHICGNRKKVPAYCPNPKCKDPAFRYAGMGTQRVEEFIAKCFPKAKIQRMDADSTARKNSHDRILGDFRTGKIDILIGTQMIAKGLHFPNVTLVGVVYADLSLHIPDFRAGERTYQLLAQVAGRAGRGDIPGEVIVQTYTPHHPAIQAARRLDYEGYCDQEIEFRRELKYPPLFHMTCITLKSSCENKAEFFASAVWKQMNNTLPPGTIVSKPSPAPIAKAQGRFRYQVLIRSGSMKPVTDLLKSVTRNFKLPKGVTMAIDVDAVSFS